MNNDSYTTVDRNKLLRQVEVMIDAMAALRKQQLEEYKVEFLEWRKKRNWSWKIFSSGLYKQYMAYTDTQMNNRILMRKVWHDIVSDWRTVPWERELDYEDTVRDLYNQLRSESTTPTIMLSTTHQIAVNKLHKILKKGNWVE